MSGETPLVLVVAGVRLQIEPPDEELPRIDAVYYHADEIGVVTGKPAKEPVAPRIPDDDAKVISYLNIGPRRC